MKRRGGISALKAPAIRGFVASILALCLVVSLLLTGIDGFVRPAGIRSAYASTGKVNTGSIGFAYSSNNDFSVTSEAAGGGNGDIDEDTTAHVATIQHDGTYSISTDAESDSSIGSDHAIMIASGVNATLKVTGDVDCEPTTAAVSGIEVGGTQAATGTALTLNVDNGVTLTVQSAVPTQSNTGLAAIHVSGNATLTIQGSGTVYATAQGGVAGSDATGQTSSSSDVFGSGAAIGSNSAEDAKAGAITIGGSVTVDAAAASQYEYVGAAIGGGGAYEDTNASASSQASSPASALYGCVSTIAINDAADVIAISSASSHSGSGIGAGAFGNGASAGNITISTTGTVVASSLLSGDDGSDALCASAGIGTYPGWLAGTNDASAITIKSGNVYAYGADASTGATEVPNSIYPQPTSDGTTLVYPVYVPSVLNNGSVDTPTADVTFSCDGYSATANAGIATGNVVDLSSVLPGNVDTFLGLSKENTGLATDADCVMWLPSTTSATTTSAKDKVFPVTGDGDFASSLGIQVDVASITGTTMPSDATDSASPYYMNVVQYLESSIDPDIGFTWSPSGNASGDSSTGILDVIGDITLTTANDDDGWTYTGGKASSDHCIRVEKAAHITVIQDTPSTASNQGTVATGGIDCEPVTYSPLPGIEDITAALDLTVSSGATVTSVGNGGYPGIDVRSNGSLTIDGEGTVEATGSVAASIMGPDVSAAGIGTPTSISSNPYSSLIASAITINSGTVIANSPSTGTSNTIIDTGAGIGGGGNVVYQNGASNITINGGTVIATSGSASYASGAGIGSGGSYDANGTGASATVAINGGTVIASAGSSGGSDDGQLGYGLGYGGISYASGTGAHGPTSIQITGGNIYTYGNDDSGSATQGSPSVPSAAQPINGSAGGSKNVYPTYVPSALGTSGTITVPNGITTGTDYIAPLCDLGSLSAIVSGPISACIWLPGAAATSYDGYAGIDIDGSSIYMASVVNQNVAYSQTQSGGAYANLNIIQEPYVTLSGGSGMVGLTVSAHDIITGTSTVTGHDDYTVSTNDPDGYTATVYVDGSNATNPYGRGAAALQGANGNDTIPPLASDGEFNEPDYWGYVLQTGTSGPYAVTNSMGDASVWWAPGTTGGGNHVISWANAVTNNPLRLWAGIYVDSAQPADTYANRVLVTVTAGA